MAGTYTDAEIDMIAGWLRQGWSSGQIADKFSAISARDTSRSAIAGLVSRNARLKAVGFARQRGAAKLRLGAGRAARPACETAVRKKPAGRIVAPVVELPSSSPDDARAYDAAARRLPLADLDWRDCRFAVNDAAPGEPHLFCGLRSEPGLSWCRHHLLRCLGAGTRGERDAELSLMRGRAA